jgi:uncharacterized SAM-binding protein YcdF (DUF218 family)
VPHSPTDNEQTTDAIIVLTGGSKRLQHSLELLEQEKAPILFVSGVGEGADYASLSALSGPLFNELEAKRVPIELGYDATSTTENAIEVAEWVAKKNYQSIRLVTANYHMPRSVMELQALMPLTHIVTDPVLPWDYEDKPWWQEAKIRTLVISEYHKFIVRYLLIHMQV